MSEQERRRLGGWGSDFLQLAVRCLIFGGALCVCVCAALFLHIEPTAQGPVVTFAIVGVLVGSWTATRSEACMSERLSRDNPVLHAVSFLAGISAWLCAVVIFVFAYWRTEAAMGSQIHLRGFLLDAKSLMAAVTALLVSIPPFFRSIANLRKEWKNMRPKTQLEGVRLVARKRSVVLPMVLAVVLAASGGSILAGRAAVADTGKTIGNVATFSVDERYTPTGKMGDIGDVTVDEEQGAVRFVYETAGRGPHLWEWKYDNDGKENPQPAQFAGVIYLDPRGNWGSDSEGGYDLRTCHGAIKWEARSIDAPVQVKFVLGGDKRDVATKERKKFAYPNTIDQALGTKKLDGQWQSFEFDLSKIPDDRFKRVVGGFGWVIAWGPNAVKLNKEETGPEQPKTFTIEIRNVRYQK